MSGEDKKFEGLLAGVDLADSLKPKVAVVNVAPQEKMQETLSDLADRQAKEQMIAIEVDGNYYMARASGVAGQNDKDKDLVALNLGSKQDAPIYLKSDVRAPADEKAEKERQEKFDALKTEKLALKGIGELEVVALDGAAAQELQDRERAGKVSILHGKLGKDSEKDSVVAFHASYTSQYDEKTGDLVKGGSVFRSLTLFNNEQAAALDALEAKGLRIDGVESVEYRDNTSAIKRTQSDPKEAERKYIAVHDKATGKLYYVLEGNGSEKLMSSGLGGEELKHSVVPVGKEGGEQIFLKGLSDEAQKEKGKAYLEVNAENGQKAYLEMIPASPFAGRALQMSEIPAVQLDDGELLLPRERQKVDGEWKQVQTMPKSFDHEKLALLEQGQAVGGKKGYGKPLPTVERESFSGRFLNSRESSEHVTRTQEFLKETPTGREYAVRDAKWGAVDPVEALVTEKSQLVLPEGTKRLTIDYNTRTISAAMSDSSNKVFRWNLDDAKQIDFSQVTGGMQVNYKGQTMGKAGQMEFTGLDNLTSVKVNGLKTRPGGQLSVGDTPMIDGNSDVAGVMNNAFAEAAGRNAKIEVNAARREVERAQIAEMRHNNYHMRQMLSHKISGDIMAHRWQHEGEKIGGAVVQGKANHVTNAWQRREQLEDHHFMQSQVASNRGRGLPPYFGLNNNQSTQQQGTQQGGFGGYQGHHQGMQQGGFGGYQGQQGGFASHPGFGVAFGAPAQQQPPSQREQEMMQLLQEQGKELRQLKMQLAGVGSQGKEQGGDPHAPPKNDGKKQASPSIVFHS